MTHLQGLRAIARKSPGDIVFLSALRTPVTRSFKGALKDTHAEQLLATVLKATRERMDGLDPAMVSDVAVGTVLSELGGSKAARMALNHAGYPDSAALYTVNRACASGLQAITNIADALVSGRIDMGIGAGMESMTRNYGSKAIPTVLWEGLRDSPVKSARDCILPMGVTSENVARRYGVNRADQDAFSVASHAKASTAQASGRFRDEIVSVETHTESGDPIIVTDDDGIRHGCSLEQLAKLKPVFSETGASTAGNSSQISDGAAAVLMTRRSTAQALGLEDRIIGKWVASKVVGVAPDEMGVGPAVAIPLLLDSTGLSTSEVDIWEINEAFASQALYCIRKLGLDIDRVNPNGGAIALGHPLGATGVRMLVSLLHEMRRTSKQVGVVSMCIGTGMGKASLILAE